MSLTTRLNVTLHTLQVMERAVHDPSGWWIEVGRWMLPAVRRVTEDGVEMSSTLPDFAHDDIEVAVLVHHGETQLVQPLRVDEGEGPLAIVFELRMADPVRA